MLYFVGLITIFLDSPEFKLGIGEEKMHPYMQNKLVSTAKKGYLDTNDYINKDQNRYKIKQKIW